MFTAVLVLNPWHSHFLGTTARSCGDKKKNVALHLSATGSSVKAIVLTLERQILSAPTFNFNGAPQDFFLTKLWVLIKLRILEDSRFSNYSQEDCFKIWLRLLSFPIRRGTASVSSPSNLICNKMQKYPSSKLPGFFPLYHALSFFLPFIVSSFFHSLFPTRRQSRLISLLFLGAINVFEKWK